MTDNKNKFLYSMKMMITMIPNRKDREKSCKFLRPESISKKQDMGRIQKLI